MATRLRPRGIVSVGGQVANPSYVPFSEGMTLSQAILRAGGATEFGAIRRVKVTRGGRMKTFDVTKIAFQNYELQADDCVEVPEMVILGM